MAITLKEKWCEITRLARLSHSLPIQALLLRSHIIFRYGFSIYAKFITGCRMLPLSTGLLNVRTTRSYGSVTIYPSLCYEKPYAEIIKYINGSKEDTLFFSLLHKLLAICIGLEFIITFVLMILLVRAIFHDEKRFREVVESYERMQAICTNTSSDKTTQAFKSKHFRIWQ